MARADLPVRSHRVTRFRPKTKKAVLNNSPIENQSSFSVKKKVPNSQVPEPSRMLLQQKNECKSFLIFIFNIFGTYSSGTRFFASAPVSRSGRLLFSSNEHASRKMMLFPRLPFLSFLNLSPAME
jgi:hypothetical protein